MVEYVITVIDNKGNEHNNISVNITDHIDWQDALAEISEKAIEWCSDNGYSYETWEFRLT